MDRILYPGEMYDHRIQCTDLRFLINFNNLGRRSEVNELIVRNRIRNVFSIFCSSADLDMSDSDSNDSYPRRISDSDPCHLDN